MAHLYKIFFWILLYVLPFGLYGQTTKEYENEEIKVINQFLYKLIDGERLSTSNKTDTSLVVYFKTRLLCDLDKNHSFKGNYKSNALIKMLETNNLGERLIDSTKIEELDGIKIFFENNVDYSLEKYNSEKVIGTIDISRISFNKSMTIGYFYYSVYCGEDCGWGDLIKIEKNNGRWIIIKYLISWVS